jgi:hypothetical protein
MLGHYTNLAEESRREDNLPLSGGARFRLWQWWPELIWRGAWLRVARRPVGSGCGVEEEDRDKKKN